jgi:pantoate--beta-alanine ligase
METVQTLTELREVRNRIPSPVGLVPTMGYLHAGHLSLVERAREECASVIVTIFVNPTQFGPQEDLDSYPQDIPRDLALLEKKGVDLVWIPERVGLYHENFQTWVEVKELTQRLEGEMRPGHFRGVTTIVAKLFNAIQPEKAYFGQKDAQQVAVIHRMVVDLNFLIEIVVCPTIREPDGLALSSRNVYLDKKERQAALVLYRALTAARRAFENGTLEAETIREIMIETIHSEPLAEMQYVSCANVDTLEELTGTVERALLSTAVLIGDTRLIDNFLIGE